MIREPQASHGHTAQGTRPDGNQPLPPGRDSPVALRAALAPLRTSRAASQTFPGRLPEALAALGLCASGVHHPWLTGHILYGKSDAQAWLRGDPQGVGSARPPPRSRCPAGLLCSRDTSGSSGRGRCEQPCRGGRRRLAGSGAREMEVLLTEHQFYHISKKCPCAEPGRTGDTVLA